MRNIIRFLPATPTLFAAALPLQAHEFSDSFAVRGILAAAFQCQDVEARLPSEDPGQSGTLEDSGDACRGGLPLQLEFSFRPDESSEFAAKLGFAAENGLNEVSPWMLAPWAADLHDNVRDINGRNRDYLLVAMYRHNFNVGDAGELRLSLGIIDSTDFLDGNVYANNEYAQFMNEAFTNSGSYALPSYDVGAALEWAAGPFSLNLVGMNIGENEAGKNYNFWGAQAAYEADTPLGHGKYRLVLSETSAAFPDPQGSGDNRRRAWGVSFDQAVGPVTGIFVRLSWQNEDAAVVYRSYYGGGFDFDGSAWGREADNIGIGYAYLDGGNLDIESTHVFETYYRLGFNEFFGITADVQYMQDNWLESNPGQEDPRGWIFGLRLTADF